MPKRVATPPPGDDEPKYLTICYPYPPHVNLELPGDRLAHVRWLACCMGSSDDLYAIFHKPSAPNMVIIEVRRNYPGFRRLLGAHKWSDFVVSPGEYRDKITKIYYSTYATGRAVEKAGWKRIFVADDWFKGFSPNNKYIVHPYPISSYCNHPSEGQTGFKLCRPIPRDMFAIQLPAPPPIPVGSASWIAQKENVSRIKRLSATAAAAGVELSKLKMPTCSTLANATGLGSLANNNTNSAYGGTDSGGYPSSSSASLGNSIPVSRTRNETNTGVSSGYSSEILPDDCDTSDGVEIRTGKNVAGGHFDAPYKEYEFGTRSFPPTTDKDGTLPCPSHGVVCKKGICNDYADMLKKIERKKKQASANDKKNQEGPVVNRGRGRGNHRARGLFSFRGASSARGIWEAKAGGDGSSVFNRGKGRGNHKATSSVPS